MRLDDKGDDDDDDDADDDDDDAVAAYNIPNPKSLIIPYRRTHTESPRNSRSATCQSLVTARMSRAAVSVCTPPRPEQSDPGLALPYRLGQEVVTKSRPISQSGPARGQ